MYISIAQAALFFTIIQNSIAELTVTIIGSNDIHGQAFPTALVRQDTG